MLLQHALHNQTFSKVRAKTVLLLAQTDSRWLDCPDRRATSRVSKDPVPMSLLATEVCIRTRQSG